MSLPSFKHQTSKTALALLPEIELPFDTAQFDNERIAVFLRCVFFGCTVSDAQAISGLSPTEYGRWIQKGGSTRSTRPDPDPTEPYITFVDLLEKCVLATKTVAISNLVRAIWEGDTDVSRWYLSRRFPQEYGEKTALPPEITGPGLQIVRLVIPSNSRDEGVAYHEAVAEEAIVSEAEIDHSTN